MATSTAHIAGPIPEIYDRHLGPVMFEPYAADLSSRAAAGATGAVLEIACGTGIVTRHLRRQLDSRLPLVATDVDEWMLHYAQAQLSGVDNIEWRRADATNLPFPAGSFQTVVSQFCDPFVDKRRAFSEIRRVLTPGGRLAFNYWDDHYSNAFARLAHETASSLIDGDLPAFFNVASRGVDAFSLHDCLAAAGFHDISIVPVPLEARSESARSFALGLVRGTPVSSVMEGCGIPTGSVVDSIAERLATIGGDAPFRTPMQAIVVSARAR